MKKPNLKLTAKDFEGFAKRGAGDLTKKEDLAIANDLKTLLQFMIKNEAEMNINLSFFKLKTDCGTYRCVTGWWCFFLGKRVEHDGRLTAFFKRVFDNFFSLRFMYKFFTKHGFNWNAFFGAPGYGNLQDRLDRTNELITAIK